MAPDLEGAAQVVRDAIAKGVVPGAVLLVGQGGSLVLTEAVGERAPGVPMTATTVFDLASLTKPMATAMSIMVLVDKGELALDARVDGLLPGLVPPDFGGAETPITIEHLLLHTSGLAPACPTSDFESGSTPEAITRFAARKLRSVPGQAFAYSDLGFILLGQVVEVVGGAPLDVFASEHVLTPLAMGDASFGVPPGDGRLERCAPTEAGVEVGVVHDPRARAMGGVAGHAGLFGSALDVASFCRYLAARPGDGPLGEGVLASMLRTRMVPSPKRDVEKARSTARDHGTARALGLDVASAYSSPRGAHFPRFRSFGHTGFTGGCFWIDPASGVWYVLMTSRLQFADPTPSVTGLRRAVSDEIAAAMGLWEPKRQPVVRTGVDVLEAEDCERLAGRRVGLITNTTGVTANGRRTIDVLHGSSHVDLVRLFSPEHGLYAKLEGKVGDGVDEATGLPVFSLYGETRKPTPEMLDGLDAVVFDVQDVGVRYYTYISTLGLTMEACADAGVSVIVLDRPNPITGDRVAGPLTDPDRLSFVGWRPMPLTHGMTMGEIGRMFRAEWEPIDCAVEVVPMEGWTREMWWEETGVPWVNPSPNMRNPTQAVLYPCIGLLEGANLSVGRGTDEPFELFGAPWIDGPRLWDALRQEALPGLEFTPIRFTPDASKFKGELCEGVHITVVDRATFQPVSTGLAIMWHLNDLFGAAFDASRGDSRMFSRATYEALIGSGDWRRVPSLWTDDVAAFLRQRAPYLLYE